VSNKDVAANSRIYDILKLIGVSNENLGVRQVVDWKDSAIAWL